MPKSYEAAIQKAFEYLRSNLSESISLADLARSVGYSPSWLIKVFLRYTGKGPMSHLISFRMEKAKDLLRNTNMTVSEIALSSGFNSHAYFSSAFQKEFNISPSEYKKVARQSRVVPKSSGDDSIAAKLWFRDSMGDGTLTQWWQPQYGEWKREGECITGKDEETFSIQLKRLLPENFRLKFEAKVDKAWGAPASTIGVALCTQETGVPFYSVILGSSSNLEGILTRSQTRVQESPRALVKDGAWHEIVVSLNDDALSIIQDNEELFLFRDPFPAPYASRCRLSLSGWRSQLSIRNIEIEDLGFLPFARSVRQADALYNSGLLAQARESYGRMLETGAPVADASEFYCKISYCFLGLKDFTQARYWASKVSALPLVDFWAQQAALVELDCDWREERTDQFLTRAAIFYKKHALRCRIKGIVRRAALDFEERGFFENALHLRKRIFEMASEGPGGDAGCLADVGESLLLLNRFEGAAAHFRELAKVEPADFALFSLCDALNSLGRPLEARTIITDIRGRAFDAVTRARCDVYEAFCLRTEGKHTEAVRMLGNVSENHPRMKGMVAFAKLSASLILVGQQDPDGALRLVGEVDRSNERDWLVGRGFRSRYDYPPHLVKKNYDKAVEALLDDSMKDDSKAAIHAEQALKAALILSLAGKMPECRKVLLETARRYPESRVHCFESLAHGLEKALKDTNHGGWAAKLLPVLNDLPYPAQVRSEIFYLAGTLFMKLGSKAEGLLLLLRSMEEDCTNQWPAVLARKEISRNAPFTE